MNRPAEITPEWLVASEAEIERFRAEQRAGRMPIGRQVPDRIFEIQHFRETWHVGRYLHEKLLAAGASDQAARDICFANGQRCAMSADPWVVTAQTLSRFLAGDVDKPGAELAERLLAGEESGGPT